MKIGQIKRVVNIRKRKSGDIKQVTYDLCCGYEPVDPVLQRLAGNGQTHCNIIRTFKTRDDPGRLTVLRVNEKSYL